MWGHTPPCRCGVCSTLKRICRHIADFSPKPGYVPFAADRLRVLAGELCDWGDSYCAGGAAPAPAQPPPQAGPGREVTEAVEKEAVHAKGEDSKASAAKKESSSILTSWQDKRRILRNSQVSLGIVGGLPKSHLCGKRRESQVSRS